MLAYTQKRPHTHTQPGGAPGLIAAGFKAPTLPPEAEEGAGPAFGPYWRRQYVFAAATMPSITFSDVGSRINKLYPDAEWIATDALHTSKRQVLHSWLEVCVCECVCVHVYAGWRCVCWLEVCVYAAGCMLAGGVCMQQVSHSWLEVCVCAHVYAGWRCVCWLEVCICSRCVCWLEVCVHFFSWLKVCICSRCVCWLEVCVCSRCVYWLKVCVHLHACVNVCICMHV